MNELRLALDICRRSEAELVKKALACEKTVETLVGWMALWGQSV